ncbi:MAG: MarR family transcriptional regulator [Burkholderiaceae bacterium]
MDRELVQHDLTSAQWFPLVHLRQVGRCKVAELARCSNIDAGSMTRLLDRLEKKGLCRRDRSTDDRRVVHVVLTPEGEAAAARAPEVLARVMNAHLSGFSHDEWRTLKAFLRRMADNGDALRQPD